MHVVAGKIPFICHCEINCVMDFSLPSGFCVCVRGLDCLCMHRGVCIDALVLSYLCTKSGNTFIQWFLACFSYIFYCYLSVCFQVINASVGNEVLSLILYCNNSNIFNICVQYVCSIFSCHPNAPLDIT